MNIAIIYDSRTGRTKNAAQGMADVLEESGHHCLVQSVTAADPAEVSQADLICMGSWVKGIFVILQHPTEETMLFIDRLGDLAGTKALVFCTYKLAAGSTLQQMAQGLEQHGAEVIAQFKYPGPNPSDEFKSFATSLESSAAM